MEFIHLADVHADRSRKKEVLYLLEKTRQVAEEHHAPVIIAGDFWNTTITNTENSGFSDFVSAVKSLCDTTAVYMLYGTQSHEPNGSLEIFSTVGAKVFAENTFLSEKDFDIAFIPEPRKYMHIGKGIPFEDSVQDSFLSFSEEVKAKRDKKKPLIVVHHGEVSGSRYQNGMQVESRAAFPKNVLADMGADYYALGHIHKPQEVFKNCFYVGSPYPKDFGETHDGGMNLVTIEDGKTSVERISFGLPTNVSEHISIENIDEIYLKDFTNKNVSVEIRIDKLLKKNFDLHELSENIKNKTNANFVRVKFDYEHSKVMRNEEIVKESSIVDKFTSYAKFNNIKYDDTLIGKLTDIQNKMFVDNFVPCDTFELEYISLRGAIGIKDGTGKDEIEIDFTKFDDGIVALIGPNGHGKTTLLENCHPYPQMLTRSGALKDHFCLHKSHRILIYKSSLGKRIKITMLIDGTSKCILTKYFVEIKEPDSDEYVPYKSCDGSYTAYMTFVESTFGSLEVFMRTSFYAKEQVKSIPDLSKATRTEKISLFSLLAGTDYLSFVSESAKDSAKIEQDRIDELTSKIESFKKLESQVAGLAEKESKAKEDFASCDSLLAEKEPVLKSLKKEQRRFENFINTFEDKRLEVADLSRDIMELEKEELELTTEQQEIKDKLRDKKILEQQYKWYEDNTQLRMDLQKSMSDKLADKVELQKKIGEVENNLKGIRSEHTKLLSKRVALQTKIENIVIPEISETCYACGQKLTKQQIAEQKEKVDEVINEKKQTETELEETHGKEKELIAREQKKCDELDQLRADDACLTDETMDIQKDINQIDMYMQTLNITEIKQVLFNSEPTLQNLEKRLEKIRRSKDEKNEKIAAYQKEIENMPESHESEISELEREMSDIKSRKDTAQAVLDFIEEQRREYNATFKELDSYKEEIKIRKKNCLDYKIIAKAFGNEGIQILELESAIPEIEEVTNGILNDSFDDRFEVSFETQRDSKDGRKIDDFIISVFDNTSARVKKLDLLCSGESVWIKQAMYYAFSIVRSRRTGFCFKTRFLDEADGSLDSTARGKYLKMIESAHRLCGANLTVLITHSQEIKDVVSQKIEL